MHCRYLFFMLVVLSLWLRAANAKEYQFIWNPYCPYVCDAEKENGKEGVAIDIIKEIFSNTPHTVTFKRIDNWLRAKQLVASCVSDGMAFTFYNTENNKLGVMIPRSPMVISHGGGYLSLAKNKISPFNLSDISNFNSIGTYQGPARDDGAMMEFLTTNSEKIIYLTGENILGRVKRMLKSGRLDIWLDSIDLLNYFLSKQQGNQFTVSASMSDVSLYGGMMFCSASPTAKHLEKIMDDGLKTLRNNGRLNQLLAAYGMQDNVGASQFNHQ